MPLLFHPNPGTFLICDFRKGFCKPEMTKRRPVVVISPRFRRREGLCTVVPLSTTPPKPVEPYHVLLKLPEPLHPKKWPATEVWAKCDMVAVVSFQRLDLIRLGKQNGKRIYNQSRLDPDTLQAVRKAVAYSIGL